MKFMSLNTLQQNDRILPLNKPANNNQPIANLMGESAVKVNGVKVLKSDNSNCQKPLWAEENFRLDPFKLPQSVTHGATHQEGMSPSTYELVLDHNGATFYKLSNEGKTVEYMIAKNAFAGVLARVFSNEDGSTTFTLELMNENEALSIPLHASKDMENIAADWHAWARAFNLPMFIQEVDGELSKVSHNKIAHSATNVQPRRRRNFAINHRPKFAINRKMGAGNTTRITSLKPLSAEEIIAGGAR